MSRPWSELRDKLPLERRMRVDRMVKAALEETTYHVMEKALGELGRNHTINICGETIQLVDHGWQNGRQEKPTVFTFDIDGNLVDISRAVKGLWIAFLIWWYLL